MSDRPLWTVDAMAAAMRRRARGLVAGRRSPASRSTRRTIAPGEAFFAIKGDNRDGHDFVAAALQAGAGLAVVAADKRDALCRATRRCWSSPTCSTACATSRAPRARARSAKIVAVTGSVGKTSTKEALRLTLATDGETHASVASYNNHWGVPLSLARCPESARYAVFEIGMNHAGEIEPLTRLVRPQVAIITTIEPVHLEFFGSLEAIADAKAEIFLGLEPGGAAVLNRDNPQFARLARSAESAGVGRIVSFGEHAGADARLIKCSLQPDGSTVQARILGTDVTYKLGAPGRHLVLNSLAVLAAAALVGADLALAALALARVAAGERARLPHRRWTCRAAASLLIDESYNANPASMRAALALLGQAECGRARPAHRGARRHAGARTARRRPASRAGGSGPSTTRSISSSAAAR